VRCSLKPSRVVTTCGFNLIFRPRIDCQPAAAQPLHLVWLIAPFSLDCVRESEYPREPCRKLILYNFRKHANCYLLRGMQTFCATLFPNKVCVRDRDGICFGSNLRWNSRRHTSIITLRGWVTHFAGAHMSCIIIIKVVCACALQRSKLKARV
jgi:hypothetical protein